MHTYLLKRVLLPLLVLASTLVVVILRLASKIACSNQSHIVVDPCPKKVYRKEYRTWQEKTRIHSPPNPPETQLHLGRIGERAALTCRRIPTPTSRPCWRQRRSRPATNMKRFVSRCVAIGVRKTLWKSQSGSNLIGRGGQNSDSTCAGSNSALIRFGMNCMHGTHWINT